jgi:hypothetical protein
VRLILVPFVERDYQLPIASRSQAWGREGEPTLVIIPSLLDSDNTPRAKSVSWLRVKWLRMSPES